MLKTILSGSLFMCALSYSSTAHADERKAKPAQTKKTDSLEHTRQRLDALIKAAARQDLVDIHSGDKTQNHKKGRMTPKSMSQKSAACDATLFAFAPETHISTYGDLENIKNQAVNAAGELDAVQLNRLAYAYLGLGFGEEALLVSLPLAENERKAVQAMAHILLESAGEDHVNFIRVHTHCNGQDKGMAQLWLDVFAPSQIALNAAELKTRQENLEALPFGLRQILGPRLGLTALSAGDIDTANSLYKTLHKSLLKRAQKTEQDAQKIKGQDLAFFEAMLIIKTDNDGETSKSKAWQILKSYASTDNPYRVQALQMLSAVKPTQKHGAVDGEAYSGFADDLDAAVQTYAGHDMGQQVLAQKVAHLANSHALDKAISLTKDSFAVGDKYFQDSVNVIGGFLHADLLSKNANTQIWALDLLIREAAFFAHLRDIDTVTRTGVAACAHLALPKLAAKIMPMKDWSSLGEDTQMFLALGLGNQDGNAHKTQSFKKQIFAQDEFKALEIQRAFADKNPGAALQILRSAPDNEMLKASYTANAWSAGYWSLVDNQMRNQSADAKPTSAVKPRRALAARLSLNAPLQAPNKAYAISDLTNLQTYLAHDLSAFEAYMQMVKTSDVEQKPNIDKQNG